MNRREDEPPTKPKNKMTINLFEVRTSEFGDNYALTHIDPDPGIPFEDRTIGSGYAEHIGEWYLPGNGSVGETNCDEPGIFIGDQLYYPHRYGKAVVLKPGIDQSRKDQWVFLKRVK